MNRRHPFELAVLVGPTDYVLGPPHAPVTVVEYGDFECPNCKQAAPVAKLMMKEFPNHVRFAYRHFPLEDIHPHALQAAEAAESAGAQGRFWEMHDLLFDRQLHLEPADLRHYAEQLDLDVARFTAEIDDDIYRQRVREHIAGGVASGVRGMPTFFVNGRIHETSFGLQALLDAVADALKARR